MATVSQVLNSPISTQPPKQRPVWMERQWVAIDGLGTVRNSLFTSTVFLGRTAKATGVILKMIPGFQILAGGLITYSAARYTIPHALEEFKAVDPNDSEGKLVAGLSVASQIGYGSFGPAFLVAGAAGIAGLATSGTASAACSRVAEIAASGVLGGICVARGLVMMARSAINLRQLVPLHENFREAVKSETATEFLESLKGMDMDVLTRRMGTDAAKAVKAFQSDLRDDQYIELIRKVDKGIFTQKCKQWLTLMIAFLMIVGGIASIVFMGGITSIAVGAIIGFSFTSMESLWLVFDKTTWLNAIVDKLYTPLELPNKDEEVSEEIEAAAYPA